jgi:hypothetical protein
MKILVAIYFGAILIDILIGVVRLKHLTTPFIVLSLLLFITFLSESIATYLPYIHLSNVVVYHFYVIIAFWLYSLIYFYLLKKSRVRGIILLVSILFSAFAIFNSLNYQKLNSFPSINIILFNVLLVIYSIYFLKHMIEIDPFNSLFKNSFFWFNTGVLTYFTLEIFIWGVMDYLIKNDKNIQMLLTFGVCISICFYGILGLSIWLDDKREGS